MTSETLVSTGTYTLNADGLLDVLVDRSRWRNGDTFEATSSSLRSTVYDIFLVARGIKWVSCCMGFGAEACGVDLGEQDTLTGRKSYIHNLSMEDHLKLPQAWLDAEVERAPGRRSRRLELKQGLGNIIRDIYRVNDAHDMDATEREFVLGHLGVLVGINFIFHGDAPAPTV
jgi:hypothetical protein